MGHFDVAVGRVGPCHGPLWPYWNFMLRIHLVYGPHWYGPFQLLQLEWFFGSSVNIRRWTYVRYCRSAVAQKLFLTGPGTFRMASVKTMLAYTCKWQR